MRAVELKTEFLKNPLGIDVKNPRLTWKCAGGKIQTAYRVKAEIDKKEVWDSGKVISSDMRAVYPLELKSRARVVWRVSLWDENGEEGETAEAFFENTVTDKAEFLAKWISGNYKVNRKKRYPVDCFRKTFNAENVVRARLYITACGLYEAKINGKKAGDFCLAPGHTDYTKRVQLQTYDITELITDGENEITVELADGWYRGSCGAWGRKNQYGTQTKFIAQLELFDKDGRCERVITDESWAWSDDGNIRFADNKDGEIIDANFTPSYSGRAKVAAHSVFPTASNNVAVTEHERFTPRIIKTPKGATVLDFGQNIAGYISFSFTAEKGKTLKLRFGETFDENGEFTQKNIQCTNKKRTVVTPLQQIVYTAKDGLNEYKTKFAIFGFQYALVETDIPFNAEDFTAIAVYSDMENTLWFECSDALINKFVENTRWSTKNNHADVPTDCPTRERHGWTGDAQIFFNTASYLFDYAAFARKYVADMTDGQRKNGVFRQITPKGGIDFYMNNMDGSAGWSDAGVLIPYRIYARYGDKRILEENYDAMRRYAVYKIKTLGKIYLTGAPTGLKPKYRKMISNYGQSYGEWAEPVDVNAFKISDFIRPHPEETTAYIAYMLEHMRKIAEILGKRGDAEYFGKFAEIAKKGYRKLVETERFTLDTDRQAKLVRPLYMDLLDEKTAEFAKLRLIRALDNYGWRLGTGFLSTPFILYVLADIDIKYAYKLLENERMPGWLFMSVTGANTVWESWEGPKAQGGVASLDHYSKGAVCEWLFDSMCGIKCGGERKFVIQPKPGGRITYAKCRYESMYGEVSSEWEKRGDKVAYKITVPPNTTAEVIIGGKTEVLSAGVYEF